MSRSSVSSISSTSSNPTAVPRVGGVRCYWALLSPRYPNPTIPGSKLELIFVHPDPVLAVHLAKQKMSFLGRGVIEFIHPAEREQARRDLTNAISADDLQGSVTRVRFARLSRLRTILGASPEENDIPFDANTFVEDDEYLVLDLVLNWVADGMLLAFFHAIRDKDPNGNNDITKKQEEWSNYCGTSNMAEDQIEALHLNIAHYIQPPTPTRFPPNRVFQLHTTAESPTLPESLTFTWPPARPAGSPTVFDGQYNAEEYADLMKGVDMDPSQLAPRPNEVRTNCTTRFGAKHSITSEGIYRHVTSVFIPYGSLIFCCFQTTKQVELSPRRPQPIMMQQSQSTGYGLMTPQQEWPPVAPPMVVGSSSTSDWRDSVVESKQEPSAYFDDSTAFSHSQAGPGPGPSPYPPAYTAPQQTYLNNPHMDFQHPQPHPNHQSHPHPHSNQQFTPQPYAPLPQHDPEPLMNLQQTNNNTSPVYHSTSPNAYSSEAYPRETSPGVPMTGATSRPLVPPPGEIECCRSCGTTQSPEWRRSESGAKDLCNACGLKLAREVAKREGRMKPRKKKADVRLPER